MKMIKYITGCLLLFLLAGCLEDKNDFNYNVTNKMDDFEVRNVVRNYSLFKDETLILSPEVKMTLKDYDDLSYEWYLNHELVWDEREYKFIANKEGRHTLLFVAVDNKTGVRFPYSIDIKVENPGVKGWLLLSRAENDRSQLSVVWSRLNTFYRQDANGEYILDEKGNKIAVDTILYEGEYIDFVPNLGYGPRKLVENFAYKQHYYPGYKFVNDEIMVVQDDRNVELRGDDYSVVSYAENEFTGAAPEDFKPVDAALSWGCKCLLNQDGYCYLSVGSVTTDLHTGRYDVQPAFSGSRMKALYPANKGVGARSQFFLMLDSRDNFCGCVDDAFVQTDEPLIDIRHNIGYKSTIAIKSSLSRYNKYFKGSSGLKNYDVLCCHYDTDGSRTPWWIAVLRNRVTGECVVNNFLVEWNSNTMSLQLQQCYPTEVERPEMVAADSKIAVLPHKDYLVIATGSDLWLYDYANDIQIKLGDLGGKQVKAMTAKDINNEKINGHLGVALDNGEFRVYEVNYNYEQPEAASLRELYRQHGFGDVVDVIFKYDSGSNLASGSLF